MTLNLTVVDAHLREMLDLEERLEIPAVDLRQLTPDERAAHVARLNDRDERGAALHARLRAAQHSARAAVIGELRRVYPLTDEGHAQVLHAARHLYFDDRDEMLAGVSAYEDLARMVLGRLPGEEPAGEAEEPVTLDALERDARAAQGTLAAARARRDALTFPDPEGLTPAGRAALLENLRAYDDAHAQVRAAEDAEWDGRLRLMRRAHAQLRRIFPDAQPGDHAQVMTYLRGQPYFRDLTLTDFVQVYADLAALFAPVDVAHWVAFTRLPVPTRAGVRAR